MGGSFIKTRFGLKKKKRYFFFIKYTILTHVVYFLPSNLALVVCFLKNKMLDLTICLKENPKTKTLTLTVLKSLSSLYGLVDAYIKIMSHYKPPYCIKKLNIVQIFSVKLVFKLLLVGRKLRLSFFSLLNHLRQFGFVFTK